MNAETILQSDILDILFDNRNKQYGAYALRKEYDKRLSIAVISITGIVLILFAWNVINNSRNSRTNALLPFTTDSAVVLKTVEIPKEPTPPLPKPKPPVAMITNPVPVIVPDKEVKDTLHIVDEFENKAIGARNVEGPEATSDVQTETIQQPEPVKTTERVRDEPEIKDRAEVMPEFPGGTAALLRFLGRNLQVPEDAPDPGQKVKVPIRFVVNKDGILSDVEFLTQSDNVFRKEILRVVAKMPRWKPGSQQGKAVAVYYTIPVIFDMTEN